MSAFDPWRILFYAFPIISRYIETSSATPLWKLHRLFASLFHMDCWKYTEEDITFWVAPDELLPGLIEDF
jgi:hypothetical protein